VEIGIPQGSQVSLILIAIKTSGLTAWVEVRVSGVKGQSFVDDLGWVTAARDVNQHVSKPEACAGENIDWAARRDLKLDTAKTEAALFNLR